VSSRTSIAVIVPVRNGETLALCLDAVLRSQRVPDELVVVDDGSTPPVAASDLPATVRLLRRTPSGPGAARNAGAAVTTAELLVFVDADVELGVDTLARLEAAYASGERAVLQCVYDADCPVTTVPARVHNTLQRHNLLSVGDTARRGEPYRLRGLSSFCIAVARGAFDAAGGFDAGIERATIEDDNLGLALIRLGYEVWVLPDVTVRHHSRPTAGRLLRRMAAMAEDRAATGPLFGTLSSLSSGRSHHRPDFLAAVALLGLAPLVPPAAGVLALSSLLVQWRSLAAIASEHGPRTALLGAPLLVGLAGAAAIGSTRGLTRRLERAIAKPKEASWVS
jgi:glycosyltransferase involved in cell wall biosynthesis